MTQINTLLELRNKIKDEKPEFIRQEYGRAKISKVWRKPKGVHSKMRHHFKGKRKSPSPGYGSPLKVKGFDKSGLIPLIVNNVNQLPDSKDYGIVIASSVGMKKKMEIIDKAEQLGLKILNFDATQYKKKVEEFMAKKKKKVEEKKKQEGEKKIRKAEQKKETKEQKESVSDEQKKEEEKKEKDRILTKRT